MMKEFIIETNILICEDGSISDHQSSIVDINWCDYTSIYLNYKGDSVGSELKRLGGLLPGNVIKGESIIEKLKYDDYHLSCEIKNSFGKTLRLAYLTFLDI